jgi:hypothetical protein
MKIIPERLEKIQTLHLKTGSHTKNEEKMCVMEAARQRK